MTIGEVARQAGLRPSTLRYYESIGLLPVPTRANGKRLYQSAILQRLSIIRTAQQAGFTLDEVRLLFNDILKRNPAAVTWHNLIEHKLNDLDVLLRNVQEMRSLLEEMQQCDNPELAECIYLTGQRHQRAKG
jgi:MerR family redox-sensitive transcriptional activator SoxR